MDLVNYLQKENTFFEDIDSIKFANLKNPKNILKNENFWKHFKNDVKTSRFNFNIEMRYNTKFIVINIEEGFFSNTDDFKNESEKLQNIAQILDLTLNNITSKELSKLAEYFGHVISSKDHQIENCSLTIDKGKISSDINKKYVVDDDIKFIIAYIWTSLDKLRYWLKTSKLHTIFQYFVIKNRLAINIIPGDEDKEFFSDFFKIYTLKRFMNIVAIKSFLIKDFNKLEELLYSLSYESDLTENIPLFPFFSEITITSENRNIWLDITKLFTYYLFMIFSNGVKHSHNTNSYSFFNFYYAFEKEQKMAFIDLDDKKIQIIFADANKTPIILDKEKSLSIYHEIIEANFLENIGKKESKLIRQSVLKSILTPPAEELANILENVDDLLKHYKAYKSKLFELNLTEINTIITQLEENSKRRSNEIANATSKMTLELSKSLLTMLGSITAAFFTWYLKITQENFEIQTWIIRGIFPLIAGLFAIFFLFQIIAIRRGVITQRRIFNEFISSIEGLTDLPIKDEVEYGFIKNYNMFRLYFWIFLVLSVFIIILSLIILPIVINIPTAPPVLYI